MSHHKNARVFRGLVYGLLSSLFIHIALFVLLLKAPTAQDQLLEEESEVVFVEYPAHHQIVTQKTFNKIPPKASRSYLSQADQSVEKETQAMLKGLFHQADSSADFSKSANSKRSESLERKQSPSVRDISSVSTPAHEGLTTSVPVQMDLGEGGFSPYLPERSRTMDFLPGVALGSHTLLNTREFKYYSYFARMKEQLYWRWTELFREESSLLSARLKRGRGQNLFHTSLYVYLSPDGEIQDISVVKSSGVESIDSIALYAFLRSAPFPNPPAGLVEEDGYIHIRQSFHLHIQPSVFENMAFR